MLDQILWMNALLCLGAGILLFIIPKITIRILGLPGTDQFFYPRLLGAALLGIGIAIIIERTAPNSIGLGAGGGVAIDLFAATTLALQLIAGRTGMAVRGRTVLWILVLGLAFMGFILIAYT